MEKVKQFVAEKMAKNEKKISEQLVHNYLVKRGLNKIAGEFKKEVGITKVTKLADLEDIVLHYNNITEKEMKLKLSTKDSKTKEVVTQKRKAESGYEESAPIVKRTRTKKIQIQNDYIKLLPDEILLKIMEYFSTKDILKKIAPVSKRFYRLCQDQNLIKKIEYRTPTSHSDLFSWSEYRVEKYFRDFSKVLRNARKLKMLSLCDVDYQTMRKIYWNQPLVNGNDLEEFHIEFDHNIWDGPFEIFLKLCVFPFLKRCPKLKVVKITSTFVSMDSDDCHLLGSLMANFNSASLQELHLIFKTMDVLVPETFLQAVKNFLKKVTENKPKLQYLGLDLNLDEFNAVFTSQDMANVKKICREITSEKKIEIELFDFGDSLFVV